MAGANLGPCRFIPACNIAWTLVNQSKSSGGNVRPAGKISDVSAQRSKTQLKGGGCISNQVPKPLSTSSSQHTRRYNYSVCRLRLFAQGGDGSHNVL